MLIISNPFALTPGHGRGIVGGSTTECVNGPNEENSRSGSFFQFEYPSPLYKSELSQHATSLSEYNEDVYDVMVDLLDANRPCLDLYKQQPYLTFPIRLKLIDFLLKMSIRLKILPFVFFKAVKIFDRYCSKRIILLDQSQLIITTCLWIASKFQGGNNHFVNLSNLEKLSTIKTINDLGYGSGGKYLGPTERFRLPKLHELVKLCGAKCKYDQGMFKQMELHVLTTLDWSLNDPSIEEFVISGSEFLILENSQPLHELFKVKEYLSYVSLYSSELIDCNLMDLGQVLLGLITETFHLNSNDEIYQSLVPEPAKIDMLIYKNIKKNLIKSILDSSEFMLKLFNSRGPMYLYQQICENYSPGSSALCAGAGAGIAGMGTGVSGVVSGAVLPATVTPRKRNIPLSPSTTASSVTSPMMMKKPNQTSPQCHYAQINTPPSSRIPPPHQISNKYHFSPQHMGSGTNKSIYKPAYTMNASTTRSLYKLPNIVTQAPPAHQVAAHQCNSLASLHSSTSQGSRGDGHDDSGVADIFEYDYSRKNGISTPLSENESPNYSNMKASTAF